jgi:hypothetical protein
MNEVVDVRGKPVKVGDTVAFAGGGRGASEFFVGTVSKVTPKGIVISYTVETEYYNGTLGKYVIEENYPMESRRNSGMFAILESE